MSDDDLRHAVLRANLDCVNHGLVVSTFGNASGIDRAAGRILIKPSGVPYDRLSAGMVDPRVSPNGYKLYAGDCCLPYPTVTGGRHVVPSIREKLMGEAFDDLRALKLLESKIGREETLKICEETLGGKISNTLIPDTDTLHKLRNKVNRLCAER